MGMGASLSILSIVVSSPSKCAKFAKGGGTGVNHRSRPRPQTMDLTPCAKPALRKGHLPTGLGNPAAGFPQLHSLDDGEVHILRLELDSR